MKYAVFIEVYHPDGYTYWNPIRETIGDSIEATQAAYDSWLIEREHLWRKTHTYSWQVCHRCHIDCLAETRAV